MRNFSDTEVSFFLGAGASMELGFPSGLGLKRKIVQNLIEESEKQLKPMATKLFGEDKVVKFAQLLADKNRSDESIDAILEKERSNDRDLLEVGRFAVWYTILEYEQKTDFSNIESFWLWRFLEQQFSEYSCFEDFYRDGPGNSTCFMNNLVINTLNYDRLAEEVIRLWALRRLSDINNIKKFNEHPLVVSHKHGSLGSLVEADALAFGAPFPTDENELMRRAHKLRFWFEVSNESYNWGVTNRIIALRDTLVILGYGYHDLIGNRFRIEPGSDCELHTVVASYYEPRSGENDPENEERKRVIDWLHDISGASVLKEDIRLLGSEVNCSGAIDDLFASK